MKLFYQDYPGCEIFNDLLVDINHAVLEHYESVCHCGKCTADILPYLARQ